MNANTTTTENTAPMPSGILSETQATDATPAKLYASKAEAEANKPADAPKGMRPFEVSKAGAVVGWINGRGYDHCLAQLARLDGYTVSTGKAAVPVTKETIASRLAEFSDEELAAMGLEPQAGEGSQEVAIAERREQPASCLAGRPGSSRAAFLVTIGSLPHLTATAAPGRPQARVAATWPAYFPLPLHAGSLDLFAVGGWCGASFPYLTLTILPHTGHRLGWSFLSQC